MALFVGFLILWLKHYVIPSAPKEALPVSIIYPIVLLTFDHLPGLLPAMACDILSGLRALMTWFLCVKQIQIKDGNKRYETLNPRIGLSYTYLMAWFVLYFPFLMAPVHQYIDFSVPESLTLWKLNITKNHTGEDITWLWFESISGIMEIATCSDVFRTYQMQTMVKNLQILQGSDQFTSLSLKVSTS